MDIPAELKNGDGMLARVKVGKDQYLQFRESHGRPSKSSTATTCRFTSLTSQDPIVA